MLTAEPCIGALDEWSRNYAYDEDAPTSTLYKGIVAFYLKQAGQFGVQPGLRITEPNSWLTIDDTPIKMAWGDYEIAQDKLTVGFCGNNASRPSIGPTIRRADYYDDLQRRRAKLPGQHVLYDSFPTHSQH